MPPPPTFTTSTQRNPDELAVLFPGMSPSRAKAAATIVRQLLDTGFDVHIHTGDGPVPHRAAGRSGNQIGWVREGFPFNPAVVIRATESQTFLWALIHEFGHSLIGDPQKPASCARYHDADCPEREQAAWDEGWKRAATLVNLDDEDAEEYRKAASFAVGEYRKAEQRPCVKCGRA